MIDIQPPDDLDANRWFDSHKDLDRDTLARRWFDALNREFYRVLTLRIIEGDRDAKMFDENSPEFVR